MMRLWLFIIVIFFSVIPTPANAQWETVHGSEERTRHCVQGIGHSSNGPAFLFTRTPDRKMNYTLVDIWSLNAGKTPWGEEPGRVLATWQKGGPLEFRDPDFQNLAEYDLGGSQNNRYGDFVMIDEPDKIQFLDIKLDEGLLYDLLGNVSRNYQAEAIFPDGRNPLVNFRTVTYPSDLGRSFPAIGDLTGDGKMELVFGNDEFEPEWHVLTAEGEMIARRFTVDAYDRAWPARATSLENGKEYVYFTTAHSSDIEPMKSRLYKLWLEPDTTQIDMPYQFKEEWMQEFPRLPQPSELYLYDLTGDGQDEIVLGFGFGEGEGPTVVVLDRKGDILYSMEEYHLGTGAIGDLNGDGMNELVWVHSEYLTDGDPEIKGPDTWITGIQWSEERFREIYRIQADDVYGAESVALCDLTGDGRDEVIVGMGEFTRRTGTPGESRAQGKLHVLNGDGDVLWNLSLPYVRPMSVAVDDLTGDGAHELLVGADGGFAFVLSPYSSPTPEEYDQLLETMLGVGKIEEKDVDRMWDILAERHGILAPQEPETQNVALPSLWIVPILGFVVLVRLAVSSGRGHR